MPGGSVGPAGGMRRGDAADALPPARRRASGWDPHGMVRKRSRAEEGVGRCPGSARTHEGVRGVTCWWPAVRLAHLRH